MIFLVGIDISDAASVHDISIHIDRVDRIRDQDDIIPVKEIGNVSGITFGAI